MRLHFFSLGISNCSGNSIEANTLNVYGRSREQRSNFSVHSRNRDRYSQARVCRELLRYKDNNYPETQCAKIYTGKAMKTQMDDSAQHMTKSNKTAMGVALLKKVF